MSAAEPTPVEQATVNVVLLDVVRQRLIQVAAEVLGGLPPDEVPASLRAVARFTPAKRHRVGAVAIAGALDVDPDFRARVAETVQAASPGLVDGLREGADLHASDPVDIAVVAYLTRLPGWQAAVSEATERWTQQRAPRDAAAEEGTRLRAELAELRSRLKSATALHRDRTEESAAITELAAARKQLRARIGEVRAAQRERDDARAVADQVRAELAATLATHEAELRRLRLRIAELEKAGEAVRRTTRTDRELDDARLRALLDTLTEAAAGVRRELSLPASALRPADTVVTAGAADGGRRAADDPAALERLLALPQAHLIVDGYNVTKTGYGGLALADQRVRLTAALAALHSRSPLEITVAFDGAARPATQTRAPRGVRVLFSAEDELADDLIRRLVAAEPTGRPVVVVTTDQQIVTDVRAMDAWTAPSSVLLALLG
jgi:hypothetical protein